MMVSIVLAGYKINDKVMQISNNYDKEVYNGDIGRVVSIDEEGKKSLCP